MTNYETAVNILDLIDAVGEDEVNRILSDFSCEKNAAEVCAAVLDKQKAS